MVYYGPRNKALKDGPDLTRGSKSILKVFLVKTKHTDESGVEGKGVCRRARARGGQHGLAKLSFLTPLFPILPSGGADSFTDSNATDF